MEPVYAALRNLADEPQKRTAERYEGFQAGGGGLVAKQAVEFHGAACTWSDDGVRVTFTQDGGAIEGTCEALGLPPNWRDFGALRLSLAGGDQAATVRLTVVGARCRIVDARDVGPGAEAELEIDLVDLPLAQGTRPSYEPTGVRITANWGDTWPTEGQYLLAGKTWPATEDNPPLTVLIRKLWLVPSAGPRPCADEFGQRINGTWPTKVRDASHMKAVLDDETHRLDEAPMHPDRDEYLGWTGGESFAATGFFRVERDGRGVWWYVDPLGRPFWSIGTTGVRTTDQTPWKGREGLFASLPDPAGPYAAAYQEFGLGLYCWNILRKHGSKEAWREHVCRRFRAWGLNTIANWSEEVMFHQTLVPYVRTLDTRIEGAARTHRRMPDVWDEGWQAALDRAFARDAAPHKHDPFLLGYFVDNEMPWGRTAIFTAPPGGAARKAWRRFALKRYPTVEAFQDHFGSRFGSWDAVEAMTADEVPAEGPALQAVDAFRAEYADRYFRTVRDTIRRHDPNHLYLGCRFVRRFPSDGIVAAAGRYCDVVSVNCYDLWPRREEFGRWHEASGRPIQIGEHHMPLYSARQLVPLYPAFAPEERRTLYAQFVRKWAEQPYAVGCHWFQHADQPLTGRHMDGENQPVGFVDITDRPHPELVAAAREVTADVYAVHAAAR